MPDYTSSNADAEESGALPSSVTPRRVRVLTTAVVAGLTVITVVPAALAAPLSDASPIMMTTGVMAGFGCHALPYLCIARKPWRRDGPDARFFTARTWTGPRTIDLHALRSVRTWKEVHRGGSTTHIIITDVSGTRLSFTGDSAPDGHRLVRWYAWERPRKESDAQPVHVTRLALADLGIKPLPRVLSVVRSLLSLGRSVLLIVGPMMISAVVVSR